ncbi:uncharacterized protein [Venturia canescens]|uniref:uncharacterized protein n=1 Tax=Venturia canescens TaxID=32260 RepID=UPI001C9CBBA6|nr:uncharacterized protein LOC122412315 [Venturia canescens]
MVIGIATCSIFGLIFCAIVAFFFFHPQKLRLHRKLGKFPGPPTLPFIGNAHYFIGDSSRILDSVTKLMDSYPSPFKIWLGDRLFFAVYEPEQLKTVFLSPKTIEKDALYQLANPWLGSGLFTAPADIWRIHRKLIAPTFNAKILESFVEVFAKQSEIMTKLMSKELGGGDFDVFEYVSLCTLDIVCETAMGVTAQAQVEKDSRYVHSAKRAFEIIWQRAFNILLHSDFIFNLTKLCRDQRECIKYLHGMTTDVIRRKKRASNGIECRVENENLGQGSTTRKAFLDLLMELSNDGTKFTEQELEDEVNTMMIAGNDTTATVNTFVLLMLASHPEVQEKAYEELCDIYGDEISTDRPIRNEDLSRMLYLERVIKETLRLFPVGPILVRQVREDLELGGGTLPKGTSVVIGLLKLHRWQKIWPDPLNFDPDRFLPEQAAKRHPYSFAPFSAGPRNCLGLKYAMIAMKVLLATVLRRYVLIKDEILAIGDIKLKAEVVLKPVIPIRLRIEKRSSKLPRSIINMIGSTATLCLTMIFGAIVFLFHSPYRKFARLYEKAANFPAPRMLPFIGHAHYFIGNTTHIMSTMMKWLSTYPSPFTIRLGAHVIFAVYQPEQLKTIFLSSKTIEKPHFYKFFGPWLGNGLFTAPAKIWRSHRKLIGPTFNMKVLTSFVEIFANQSEIMVKRMSQELGGKDFDVYKYITLCTLDIVCETAMGVSAKSQLEKDSRYVVSGEKAFQTVCKRMFKIWYHPDIIFKFTELCREQNDCIKCLHDVTNSVIQRKKNELKSRDCSCLNDDDYFEERSPRKKAFLDLLIELSENGAKLSEVELRDEVNTIMIAGNDATATASAYVMYMLANYPDIQEKVYVELHEIYGDEVSSENPIKSKDLELMVYLERVIKETLRLFPVVPMFLRELDEDIDIDGGRILPKGGIVLLAAVEVHRLESVWPDPLKFDSDRFLPEQVAKRHPYSYIPFSAGPRNCIGLKYAMMAMKVMLATVLRRYVLIKDEKIVNIKDIKFKSEVSLKPVVPLELRIVRRQGF